MIYNDFLSRNGTEVMSKYGLKIVFKTFWDAEMCAKRFVFKHIIFDGII